MTNMSADHDAFEEEFGVDGDVRSVLPEGEYEVVCTGAEIIELYKFGRARKLFLHFQVYGGEHNGTRLFLPMTAPAKGEKMGRGSKLYANYMIANGSPPARRDRVSLKVFKGRVFQVRVKTVCPAFESGKLKPESFHYSIVAELLERLA